MSELGHTTLVNIPDFLLTGYIQKCIQFFRSHYSARVDQKSIHRYQNKYLPVGNLHSPFCNQVKDRVKLSHLFSLFTPMPLIKKNVYDCNVNIIINFSFIIKNLMFISQEGTLLKRSRLIKESIFVNFVENVQ